MKILYITTIGCTMVFFKDFISKLIEEGHTVDIACNDRESKVDELYNEIGCNIYTIDSSRSPIDKGNIRAIKQIEKIVKENEYDIVHCHTPIAAACTRIACKGFRKKGLKVIYTAHGFHFFKGCPFINKLIFYPIEKICSYFTDVLININKEDFELAKKKFKAKKIEYVAGVGIDVAKFRDTCVDVSAKRVEIGVPEDAYIVISVGELNLNKNHKTVINAISEMQNDKIHYVVAGEGPLKEELNAFAYEKGIADKVHLLGRRNDVAELFKCSDVFVHPSFREGLPVAVMEAMASGLACVVSNIRGSRDLIVHGKGGIIVTDNCSDCYKAAISEIILQDKMDYFNFNTKEAENYDVKKINSSLLKIYGINQ